MRGLLGLRLLLLLLLPNLRMLRLLPLLLLFNLLLRLLGPIEDLAVLPDSPRRGVASEAVDLTLQLWGPLRARLPLESAFSTKFAFT